MFSHFTLEQANKMLPSVIEKFNSILDAKDQVVNIQSDFETNPKYMASFKYYIIKKQKAPLQWGFLSLFSFDPCLLFYIRLCS